MISMGVNSFLRPNNATMNAERVRIEDEEKDYLNFAGLLFFAVFSGRTNSDMVDRSIRRH